VTAGRVLGGAAAVDRRPGCILPPMRHTVAVLCLVAVAAAGCGGDDDSGDLGASTTTGPTSTTADDGGESTAPPVPPLSDVNVTLTEVAEADAPMAVVARTGTDTLYVAERAGRVRPMTDGSLGEAILDISDDVVTEVEQGLLDIEFSPDGDTLYVHYSIAPDGDTRVVAYPMRGDEVDAGVRRELLAVEQPFDNHNGGDIEIGPDGYLYVALGDGGGGGDPEGNGQDTQALLGKILRIDPAATTGNDYAIPADNPFADGAGGAAEVWIYGARNPWRIDFDEATGDLWVADVGQNEFEEIDLLPAADGAGRGANLGWNEMEGAHPFEGGSNPDGAVLPVFEYDRSEGGCSVSGGVVYRGSTIPELVGAYLFTDFCDGRLRAIRADGGQTVDERTFDDVSGDALVSFGTDAAGEVYVVSLEGPIFRLDPA
jgi:glucose/arabinose dehydrogenase